MKFKVSLVVIVLALVALAPVAASGPLRHAYVTTLQRFGARLVPAELVVIGDSRARQTCWACRLHLNPLRSVNLAQGGVTTQQAAPQASMAAHFRPKAILIAVGTNDVVLTQAAASEVGADFRALLAATPARARRIVTLVPYTAFGGHTQAITDINREIEAVAREAGAVVIDLNPQISSGGRLQARYTTDGVHLTKAAYAIWAAQVKKAL